MPVQNLFGPLKCLWESGVLTIFKYPKADFILGCPVLSRKFTNSNPKNIIIVNLQNSRIISYAWVKVWLYKSGMQTSPLTFLTIFEACRLILAPQHMFPLILLGLRILKWGETFLWVNFGIIYGYFKGPGGNSMWLRPSQKLLV